MASRYPTVPVVDYCYNPRHIVDNDKDIIVPCGHCDGCLLHKANEWSIRCGMEIESTPVTIFGSLTYDNKYLPKLKPLELMRLTPVGNIDLLGYPVDFPHTLMLDYDVTWISDYPENVRFNGVRDVPRDDRIIVNYSYAALPIKNWDNFNFPRINYASKRDIQLWLKLLRKQLDDYGIYKDKRVLKRGFFRYFIISEVGPTTFRNHYHFLIFCQSKEIASALLEGALYKNWKMCSEDRFTPYCHVCDSGARGYVTQYLTSFSSLPSVYREVKELRPFRLASKSPGIGYIEQDKAKIYQDVERGIIKYSRPLRRLESNSILFYPKNYLITLFPKCYRFAKISDSRREFIYGYLYRTSRETGRSFAFLRSRFSKIFNASDFLAMCACARFCVDYGSDPSYYYYLLDMYYYKLEMSHLKSFYELQMSCDFNSEPYKIFEYYPNIEQICCTEPYDLRSVEFLCDLGFDLCSLVDNKEFFLLVRKWIFSKNDLYRRQVSDIVNGMIKVAKFNELTNNSPSNV